jgi:transposase
MFPSAVRIFVCTIPQDMRKSYDTLAAQVRALLGHDPLSGSLYVFIGKHATRAKVLWADAQGMYLLQRRLHRAVLLLPPPAPGSPSVQIDGKALAELLSGVPRVKKSPKKELH